MRRVAFVLTAAVAVGCGGAKSTPTKPEPVVVVADAAPAEPTEPPIVAAPASDAVFGVLSIPKPMMFVIQMGMYAKTFQPGAEAVLGPELLPQLAASLIGAQQPVAGVDWERPVHALYVEVDGGDEPWALLVPVSDADALAASVESANVTVRSHEGYALIGARDVVSESANYALGTLRASSVLTDPTVIVRANVLMARYGAYLESMVPLLKQAIAAQPDDRSAPAAMIMLDGLVSLARQVVDVRASLRFDGGEASFHVEVVGVPDSALTKFVAAQSPANYDIAKRLPGSVASMLMAGRLSFDSSTGLGDSWAQATAAMLSSGDENVAKAYAEWFSVMSGEWAAAFNFEGGMTMSMVNATDDGAALLAVVRRAFLALSKAKTTMPTTYKKIGTPRFKIKRIPIDEYSMTTDVSKMPEEQRAAVEKLGTAKASILWTQTGGTFMYATGSKAKARAAIAKMIDISRAREQVLFKGWAELFERSRSHGESFLVAMDIAALAAMSDPTYTGLVAPPVEFGIGFRERSVRFRVSVPAAVVGAFAGAQTAAEAQDRVALVVRFDDLADRACKCKDAACAQAIGVEMMAILEGVDRHDEPSKGDQEKLMAAMERIQACTSKLVK